MKNLEKYGVIKIDKNESSKINGGEDGWIYNLGAAAHGAWCSIRDTYLEHPPGYVGTQYGV